MQHLNANMLCGRATGAEVVQDYGLGWHAGGHDWFVLVLPTGDRITFQDFDGTGLEAAIQIV